MFGRLKLPMSATFRGRRRRTSVPATLIWDSTQRLATTGTEVWPTHHYYSEIFSPQVSYILQDPSLAFEIGPCLRRS
jgi:hypothetical protein